MPILATLAFLKWSAFIVILRSPLTLGATDIKVVLTLCLVLAALLLANYAAFMLGRDDAFNWRLLMLALFYCGIEATFLILSGIAATYKFVF